jgi:predicted DNA-binding antitoxin AbrB/MazE fold protein
MVREIRAKFSKGVFRPLEPLDLAEGDEGILSIAEAPGAQAQEAFNKAAGGWKDTLDFEQFLKDLRTSRRQRSAKVS